MATHPHPRYFALSLGLSLISLMACGGGGSTATAPVNHPPALTSTPLTTATVGMAYIYTPTATDADNDSVNFSLVTGPTGANLTAGTLTWTPTAGQAGQACGFTLQASDGKGGTASQTWSVTPAAAANMATISGTLVDTAGTPVEGATVTIHSDPVTTTTNAQGQFSAQVPAGDHQLTASKSGITFLTSSFSATAGSTQNLGSQKPSVATYYGSSVIGLWSGNNTGGASVFMSFAPDGTYIVNGVHNGRVDGFAGTYTVSGNRFSMTVKAFWGDNCGPVGDVMAGDMAVSGSTLSMTNVAFNGVPDSTANGTYTRTASSTGIVGLWAYLGDGSSVALFTPNGYEIYRHALNGRDQYFVGTYQLNGNTLAVTTVFDSSGQLAPGTQGSWAVQVTATTMALDGSPSLSRIQ